MNNRTLNFNSGFTLIELLVVIAILGVLVTIALIAINPIQRIHDSSDDRSSYNVRSVATVIEACLSSEGNHLSDCDEGAELIPNWIRSNSQVGFGNGTASDTRVQVVSDDLINPTIIDLCQPGGEGDRIVWNTTNTRVEHQLGSCP